MSYVKSKEELKFPEALQDQPGDSEDIKAKKSNARLQIDQNDFQVQASLVQAHVALPRALVVE